MYLISERCEEVTHYIISNFHYGSHFIAENSFITVASSTTQNPNGFASYEMDFISVMFISQANLFAIDLQTLLTNALIWKVRKLSDSNYPGIGDSVNFSQGQWNVFINRIDN